MTTKKKTKKKVQRATQKTTRKSAPKAPTKSRLQTVKKTTRRMVDDFLIKVNPQVQKQLEHLKGTLEKTPTSMADLKMLGLKVLERAKKLSQTLRAESSIKKRKKQ